MLCKKILVVFMAAVVTFAIVEGCAANTQEEDRPEVAREIKKYLDENFAETTWHGSITGISVRGATVIASTKLTSKEERASGVCRGVSGFVFSNLNRHLGLNNVQVTAKDGEILINRQGVAQRCQ